MNPSLKKLLDPYSPDNNLNRNRAMKFSSIAMEAIYKKNIAKPKSKEESEIVLGIIED